MLGFSHGAWTILDALALATAEPGSDQVGLIRRVKRMIAFYPYSGFPAAHRNGWQIDNPALGTLARNDVVVPTSAARKAFERQKEKGFDAEVHVLEGATHSFDLPGANSHKHVYDRSVVEKARGLVAVFLEHVMK